MPSSVYICLSASVQVEESVPAVHASVALPHRMVPAVLHIEVLAVSALLRRRFASTQQMT